MVALLLQAPVWALAGFSTFEPEIVWVVVVGEHGGPQFYKQMSEELDIASVGHGREQKPGCCSDEGWPAIPEASRH